MLLATHGHCMAGTHPIEIERTHAMLRQNLRTCRDYRGRPNFEPCARGSTLPGTHKCLVRIRERRAVRAAEDAGVDADAGAINPACHVTTSMHHWRRAMSGRWRTHAWSTMWKRVLGGWDVPTTWSSSSSPLMRQPSLSHAAPLPSMCAQTSQLSLRMKWRALQPGQRGQGWPGSCTGVHGGSGIAAAGAL